MEKTDVFVWVEGEDGAGASLAVRALRNHIKAATGDWYLVLAQSEKAARLAYDLGMKSLVRPASLAELPTLASAHGASPGVLLWSGAAVLVTDWNPWQGDLPRLWEPCPAALVPRSRLAAPAEATWPALQQLAADRSPLPAGQVKVLSVAEFDKAVHGTAWPFGPSVVLAETPAPRR